MKFSTTNLFLYLPLLSLLTFACQSDHGSAQEQFRERQESILEREDEKDEEIDTSYNDAEYITTDAVESPTTPDKKISTTGDKVVGVKDGDTVVLLVNGEEVTVRLHGVDTPEKSQAYGQKAKQFTSDLIFGKSVRLITHNKDRYGRTVGTIILPDGRSLNEELIKNGFAWHYKAYSKDVNLANAEVDARRFKRGLWQDPDPVAPWDYRKNKRNNTVKKEASTAPLPAGASKRMVYICNSSGSAVYHTDNTCHVLKRCKAEVIKVTEAEAIRTYDRRQDKSCD
jgi:micrococcal nuclease